MSTLPTWLTSLNYTQNYAAAGQTCSMSTDPQWTTKILQWRKKLIAELSGQDLSHIMRALCQLYYWAKWLTCVTCKKTAEGYGWIDHAENDLICFKVKKCFLFLIWNTETALNNIWKQFESRHDKTCLREFPTWPDTNRPAQPQKLARVLKFQLQNLEILYYLSSEQQRRWSDCADVQADLRLCCCSHMT